jgi:hypothetical protein
MKRILESKQSLELDDTLARIVKELSCFGLWITPSETSKINPQVPPDLSLIRVHAGFLGFVPESLRKRASRSAV